MFGGSGRRPGSQLLAGLTLVTGGLVLIWLVWLEGGPDGHAPRVRLQAERTSPAVDRPRKPRNREVDDVAGRATSPGQRPPASGRSARPVQKTESTEQDTHDRELARLEARDRALRRAYVEKERKRMWRGWLQFADASLRASERLEDLPGPAGIPLGHPWPTKKDRYDLGMLAVEIGLRRLELLLQPTCDPDLRRLNMLREGAGAATPDWYDDWPADASPLDRLSPGDREKFERHHSLTLRYLLSMARPGEPPLVRAAAVKDLTAFAESGARVPDSTLTRLERWYRGKAHFLVRRAILRFFLRRASRAEFKRDLRDGVEDEPRRKLYEQGGWCRAQVRRIARQETDPVLKQMAAEQGGDD